MRGQATLFIVIGIIIVAIVGLSLYVSKRDIIENVFTATKIPEEVKEIDNFVRACIVEVGSEGLNILGLQGGYINIPESEIPNILNPFSNRLSVLPGIDVAYWFYEKSNRIQENQVPSLEIMEEELNRYLEVNLPGCIRDFNDFSYDIDFGEINVDTRIRDDVEFEVDFPLVISIEDSVSRINEFIVSVDSSLKELYDIAVE